MKYDINENRVTIFLEGKIDSENASVTETEINEIIEKEIGKELYFDFENLEYISSAGLRIFVSLAKKHKDMCIENAGDAVWDIFDVTGMNQIVNIRRKLREISLDGAKLIGDGFFSKVYKIDNETIVKQYVRDPKIDDVYRELKLAKQAFIQGIPTAISYDVVLAAGKYGVVFEMINGGSLKDAILDCYGIDSKKTSKLMRAHGNLIKTINKTPVLNKEVPSAKAIFLNRMENGKGLLNPGTYEKLKRMVEEIPETNTYVHGDCHIKNILCDDNGDFQLIDMDTLSFGNPIFEFMGLNFCYNIFEQFDPGNNERFFGVKREIIKELFLNIIDVYFEGKSSKEIEEYRKKMDIISTAHMIFWHKENKPDDINMIKAGCAYLDEIICDLDTLGLPKIE